MEATFDRNELVTDLLSLPAEIATAEGDLLAAQRCLSRAARNIPGRLMQPADDRSVTAQRSGSLRQREKNGLCCVFCILCLSQHTQTDAVYPRAMPGDEFLEELFLTGVGEMLQQAAVVELSVVHA